MTALYACVAENLAIKNRINLSELTSLNCSKMYQRNKIENSFDKMSKQFCILTHQSHIS